MKILFLTNFFPPTHTAGTETYTYGIAQELARRGHSIQVMCAGHWGEGKRHWNGVSNEIYNGLSICRLHINWTKAPDPNRTLYDNPAVATFLRRALAQWRPDLVHITSLYTLSASVIDVIKEAGLPLVLTLTDYWFLCPRVTLLRSDLTLCDGRTTAWECLRCSLRYAKSYRWLTRLLPEPWVQRALVAVSQRPALNRLPSLIGMALDVGHRRAFLTARLRQVDHILAPSSYLAKVHAAAGIVQPIVVQPYGHDLAFMKHAPPRSRCQHVRFGYLGQILRPKGVDLAIRAFRQLKDGPAATLDIWGDSTRDPIYTRELQRLAGDAEGIRWRGPYTRERLGEVLANIDVVVVPSLWHENNPLVIQEAFASQAPVIAADVGGMREFVQAEVSGLLFAPGDPNDLARQMRRLIEEPQVIERLRAGIPAVKTVAQEVSELVLCYTQVIENSSRLSRMESNYACEPSFSSSDRSSLEPVRSDGAMSTIIGIP